MARVVWDRSEEVVRFVEDRIPDEGLGNAAGLGVAANYAADSPIWARPHLIAEMLSYPFEKCDVYRLFVTVRLDNEHSQKTVEHIGFKREATLASGFGPGKHAVVSRMLLPDYQRLYGEYR